MKTDRFEVKLLQGYSRCGASACPAVYETSRDTFVVQGWRLPAAETTQIPRGVGEDTVEVPRELLLEFAKKLLEN